MGHKISSSEIDQMVLLGWKKAVLKLKYVFANKPEEVYKITGKPQGVLWYFDQFKNNPRIKIISFQKAFELQDVPEKIWRSVKRIKYIPTLLRSQRNELRYILKQTCHFGPRED